MNFDLFDLTNFESKSENDIINMNVDDESFSEGTDVNIPVPGGDKETPDEKPYDASSISIPSKITITVDKWNHMMTELKKSFKEAFEVMDVLENAEIIENDNLDELQESYIESVIGDQLLAAYEDGPYFEAVKREDKTEVKSLVKEIRSRMPELCKKYNVSFKPPKTFLRLLTNVSATITTSETSKDNVADKVTWWTTRFWQVLGVIYTENANIKTIIEKMNEDLSDVLGEYKILYSMSMSGLYDLWNNKFGWKNRNQTFFLIVDKSLPKELKEIQNDMVSAVKKENK